jgi:hypothetical protein
VVAISQDAAQPATTTTIEQTITTIYLHSRAEMITRSKAKAMEAQAKLNAPKRVPTLAPAQQPSAHVPAEIPQTRQPDQLRTSRRDHDQQQQHAELEAALLAAVMQMAVNPNRTEAQAGQQPINETAFYATAPRNQATTAACLDLMRTSGKITVQFLRVTLMACQVSNTVHQKVASISSYITAKEQSFWPGLFAVAVLVVLLHLFDVLCVRRVLTRASMGERITASAAIFLGIAERLRERLGWMLLFQL